MKLLSNPSLLFKRARNVDQALRHLCWLLTKEVDRLILQRESLWSVLSHWELLEDTFEEQKKKTEAVISKSISRVRRQSRGRKIPCRCSKCVASRRTRPKQPTEKTISQLDDTQPLTKEETTVVQEEDSPMVQSSQSCMPIPSSSEEPCHSDSSPSANSVNSQSSESKAPIKEESSKRSRCRSKCQKLRVDYDTPQGRKFNLQTLLATHSRGYHVELAPQLASTVTEKKHKQKVKELITNLRRGNDAPFYLFKLRGHSNVFEARITRNFRLVALRISERDLSQNQPGRYRIYAVCSHAETRHTALSVATKYSTLNC